MPAKTKDFGATAVSLSRNPLGIIALFIVMVYGFASLVAAFSNSFAPGEKVPLIYFLVIFPILVLAVFAWLVSCHSAKLYGPGDYKNEENYLRMQLGVVASLTAAAVKADKLQTESQLDDIIETVRAASPAESSPTGGWETQVLWVDDNPDNNIYERNAFEAIGLRFTLALSTSEALEKLKGVKFAAIISDMGRKEGPREGYVLLDRLRAEGNRTPLFFYASSNAPEHKRETKEHGGQGCTNNARELFEMVTNAVIRKRNA